jgi:hypothetical protein
MDPSSALLSGLTRYCLFGTHSEECLRDRIERLKKEGYRFREVSAGMQVETVTLPEDHIGVLDVRLAAYRGAGKAVSTAAASDMSDDYDDRATLLLARIDGAVVGTARIIKSDGQSEFQFERYFPEARLEPATRQMSCEVSKLAILPELQGTDIVLALFRAVYEHVLRSRVENVYLVATKTLEPLYAKLGADRVAESIPHPTVPDETMALFVLRARIFTRAGRMTAHCWQLVAQGVVERMNYYGITRLHPNRLWLRLRLIIEAVALKYLSKKKAGKK